MKYLATLVVGFAMFFASCGTTHPYEGPVADYPKVDTVVWRMMDSVSDPRNPHWIRQTRLDIANPSLKPMTVVLDCDAKDPTRGAGTGTYSHLTIPARTTQQVLLGSDDVVCLVSRE